MKFLTGGAALLVLIFSTGFLCAQPYGLTNGAALGPYLNNSLPSSAPNSTAAYDVTIAYTNLTFNQPLFLTPYPKTNWQVLIEKPGMIRIFPNRPDVQTSEVKLFLDISSRVFTISDSGMTSIAFHPEFGLAGSTNRGFVYVTYKWRPNPDLGAIVDFSYYRLSRFTVPDGTMAADPNSEVILLQQFDQQEWHDSGCLMFGLDGYLYFGVGDEGGANDQYNVTQILNQRLMSGIFRVDVNFNPSTSHPIRRQPFHHPNLPVGWPESYSTNYFVPNNNPFVSVTGTNLEEYYALGFRNPYRFSQDPVTGRIWVGDVGQDTREEVDILLPGRNYQWAYMEGFANGPKARPASIIGIEQSPLFDYPHAGGDGCVIGGFVYRGTNFPGLVGKYISVDNDSGRIRALTSADGVTLDSVEQIASLPPGSVYGGSSACGLDANGEIYFVKIGGVGAGKIYKIITIVDFIADPASPLSQLGAFTNLATLTPVLGIHPYTVNSPLWSDGAVKKRWLGVPNDGTHDTPAEQIVFSPTNEWQFPAGTVFMKQFELPADDTNPALTQRVETRFLVADKNGGFYGLTYKWRADGSDADLLSAGTNADYVINGLGGIQRTQTWSFPSRQDCLICHNPNAGYVLGLKTHQLNCPTTYPETGVTDNQLRALGHIGLLGTNYNEAQLGNYLKSYAVTNTAVSLELRVRSYLDANCSQCHRPGGVQAFFDARLVTPLAYQGLIQGPSYTFITDPSDRVIVPQDLTHSLLFNRVSRVGQFQMPPLAKNLVDTNAVQVIANWINSLPLGPGVILSAVGNNVTGPFTVQVQFTVPVSTLTTNQFQVLNGAVTSLTGSGANYSLVVTPLSLGAVSVRLPAGQVQDGSSQPNYDSNLLIVNYSSTDPDLITWLRFDEGSGLAAADSSPQGNRGVLVNMTSASWTNGLFGGALAFNGINNYVNISNVVSGDFTLSCWIKSTQAFQVSDNTYGGTGLIWSDIGGVANDFILGGTRSAGGVDRLSFFTGNPDVSVNGATEISTGQWMHLAATRNGANGQLNVFVNGQLDASGTGGTSLLTANSSINIGGNTGDGRYFQGLIDDVRIYSRVLSPAEITNLFNLYVSPTLSQIADVTVYTNSFTLPLSFTITNGTVPATLLTLTAGASNPTLVPTNNIVFGGSGTSRTLTVTPATNSLGSTVISYAVSDGQVTVAKSFTVTVVRGLVAYYQLENNALDSSGSGNHGTINGGVTFVAGKVGTKAAQFDGTSGYVQIPASVSGDFTIAFWARTTATGGSPQWYNGQGFVDGDSPGPNADFGTALVGNNFGFGVGNPNTTLTATNVINDGQWHHLTATRVSASGLMTVFVDGLQQGTMTGPTGSRTAPPFLRLGGLESGGGFLTGALDDVRLYDFVLSSNQIIALMNTAPVLAAISNRAVLAGATLLVTNTATDADVPAQTLTYGLSSPPSGAGINSNSGVLSWRPFISQAGHSNLLSVSVTDNGTPPLSATQNFWVTVNRPAQPAISGAAVNQGKFQLVISGDRGPDYSVQGSTNLQSWATIQTTNSPALPFLFVDPGSSNYSRRFYRVLLGP